jgi:hypothetical protein
MFHQPTEGNTRAFVAGVVAAVVAVVAVIILAAAGGQSTRRHPGRGAGRSIGS